MGAGGHQVAKTETATFNGARGPGGRRRPRFSSGSVDRKKMAVMNFPFAVLRLEGPRMLRDCFSCLVLELFSSKRLVACDPPPHTH